MQNFPGGKSPDPINIVHICYVAHAIYVLNNYTLTQWTCGEFVTTSSTNQIQVVVILLVTLHWIYQF